MHGAAPARAGDVTRRVRLRVSGAVQGVGFRPFVYRLARELELRGFVENSTQGVTIEAEGDGARLREFEARLRSDKPEHARIFTLESQALPVDGAPGFAIRHSDTAGAPTALVLPDLATCSDCLRELRDPRDRRHRYPFTNCTRCGPRYSIVLGLPYDRARTTMARFPMCPRCLAEYEDPGDRRFHAEPTACPDCGPQLALWDAGGAVLAERDDALHAACDALRDGRIVALKGLGGFHLTCDARREDVVAELRRRKRREAKPLALLVPSLEAARRVCAFEPLEQELLLSSQAPIVLAHRAPAADVADSVAPGNPYIGVMLPYTPLHHLLMEALGFPVVATSGNLSDEPICTDEREALERLRGIADLFLVHDRPIARHVDDSLARVVADRPLLLRRARGYAPFPVAAGPERALLGVGAHLKNTVALTNGGRVVLGPHIGDLETEAAFGALRGTIATLRALYDATPDVVACDAHPDYLSTQWARGGATPVVAVQHHHAHALACLADNGLAPGTTALAVTWDGSGFGLDGTVWGGEFLRLNARGFERYARLRRFALPGGERAVREPRRSALGALHALEGERVLDDAADPVWRLFGEDARARGVLAAMLRRGLNCPLTSSAGRLFDAVAALCGLHPVARFEGQAAMALEFAAERPRRRGGTQGSEYAQGVYPFALVAGDAGDVVGGAALEVDWGPMLAAIRRDIAAEADAGDVARRFHDTLAEMIVAVARRCGEPRVLLTGGCFQNRRLSERAIERLRAAGFEPLWHRDVPPNDGGIAVGQLLAVSTS
jgi:hydrogenase maturation protein HypF